MSFGGGGSGGSSTVAAHTHNSALSGDGGSLDSTLTQLDNKNLYTRILVGAWYENKRTYWTPTLVWYTL